MSEVAEEQPDGVSSSTESNESPDNIGNMSSGSTESNEDSSGEEGYSSSSDTSRSVGGSETRSSSESTVSHSDEDSGEAEEASDGESSEESDDDVVTPAVATTTTPALTAAPIPLQPVPTPVQPVVVETSTEQVVAHATPTLAAPATTSEADTATPHKRRRGWKGWNPLRKSAKARQAESTSDKSASAEMLILPLAPPRLPSEEGGIVPPAVKAPSLPVEVQEESSPDSESSESDSEDLSSSSEDSSEESSSEESSSEVSSSASDSEETGSQEAGSSSSSSFYSGESSEESSSLGDTEAYGSTLGSSTLHSTSSQKFGSAWGEAVAAATAGEVTSEVTAPTETATSSSPPIQSMSEESMPPLDAAMEESSESASSFAIDPSSSSSSHEEGGSPGNANDPERPDVVSPMEEYADEDVVMQEETVKHVDMEVEEVAATEVVATEVVATETAATKAENVSQSEASMPILASGGEVHPDTGSLNVQDTEMANTEEEPSEHEEEYPIIWERHHDVHDGIEPLKPSRDVNSSATDESETGWVSEDGFTSSEEDVNPAEDADNPQGADTVIPVAPPSPQTTLKSFSVENPYGPVEPITLAAAVPAVPSQELEETSAQIPRTEDKPKGIKRLFRAFSKRIRARQGRAADQDSPETNNTMQAPMLTEQGDVRYMGEDDASSSQSEHNSIADDIAALSQIKHGSLPSIAESTQAMFQTSDTFLNANADMIAALKNADDTERTATDFTDDDFDRSRSQRSTLGADDPAVLVESSNDRVDTQVSADSEFSYDPEYGLVTRNVAMPGIDLTSSGDEATGLTQATAGVDLVEEFGDEHSVDEGSTRRILGVADLGEFKEEERFHDEEIGALDQNGHQHTSYPSTLSEPLLRGKPSTLPVYQGEADLPDAEEGKTQLASGSHRNIDADGRSVNGRFSFLRRFSAVPIRCTFSTLFCLAFLFVVIPLVFGLAFGLSGDNDRDLGPTETLMPTQSPNQDVFFETRNPTASPSTSPPSSSPSLVPSSLPSPNPTTMAPSAVPSYSPTVSPTVPQELVVQNSSPFAPYVVDVIDATEDDPVELFATHLSQNVNVMMILPNANTSAAVYSAQDAFVELGSACPYSGSTLLWSSATPNATKSFIDLDGAGDILFVSLTGLTTSLFVCSEDTLVAASYHMVLDTEISSNVRMTKIAVGSLLVYTFSHLLFCVTLQTFFTLTVDFSQGPKERAYQRGPGVGLNSTAFLLMMEFEQTSFFSSRLVQRQIGSECPDYVDVKMFPTALPLHVFKVDGPEDEDIYACTNGTVSGRMFLDYVPLQETFPSEGGI